MARALLFTVAATLAVFAGSSPAGAQSPADHEIGERIFLAQCARCHGVGGTGGEGPALQGRRFRTVQTEADIVGVILDGLGGMPGMWMGELEAAKIAAYVMSLARAEAVSVPGDPVAGKAVFEGKGACDACHIVAGKGTGLGPELTDVGLRRGAAYLRQAVVAPGAELPRGELSPHASFLLVSTELMDGTSLQGMRVWEDAFVLTLRDAVGTYHALKKASLRGFERRFGTSLMPDYTALLSEDEVTDLVAYMSSLRGSR